MYVFSRKHKSPTFIKIRGNQTGHSSCYLRDGGGWRLSTTLLFRQLHAIGTSPHATPHLLPPAISLGFDQEPPCTGQLHRHCYPAACPSPAQKGFGKNSTPLTHSMVSSKGLIKPRVPPTPVRRSSRSRVHCTDQFKGFFPAQRL